MNKCTVCNVIITLLNTKGSCMSIDSSDTKIKRCGTCYLSRKREERRKVNLRKNQIQINQNIKGENKNENKIHNTDSR